MTAQSAVSPGTCDPHCFNCFTTLSAMPVKQATTFKPDKHSLLRRDLSRWHFLRPFFGTLIVLYNAARMYVSYKTVLKLGGQVRPCKDAGLACRHAPKQERRLLNAGHFSFQN